MRKSINRTEQDRNQGGGKDTTRASAEDNPCAEIERIEEQQGEARRLGLGFSKREGVVAPRMNLVIQLEGEVVRNSQQICQRNNDGVGRNLEIWMTCCIVIGRSRS
ncbi:hypothetical protein ACFX1X_017663 [Malus domestica]